MDLRSHYRALGDTGIEVSPIGLGTVKLGRNRDVKYPDPFTLPDDDAVRALLAVAREHGINLLDTAPAYGASESRLGELIGNRNDWILCTKVGESWDGNGSTFDFSADAIRASVERSLRRLRTDVIDIVLIHSDGADVGILQGDAVATLDDLKRRGLIRAFGMSTKTAAGTLLAAETCDVLMTTFTEDEPDVREAAIAAGTAGAGLLVKKALQSGHRADGAALASPLASAAVSSVVVGTISTKHLTENVGQVLAAVA